MKMIAKKKKKKKRENSFRKYSLTIYTAVLHLEWPTEEKYLVYRQGFTSLVDILVMIFISSPYKKWDLLGCAVHLRLAPSATITCMFCAMRKSA